MRGAVVKEGDRDTLIGTAVLVAGACLLAFAYGSSSSAGVAGYDVEARFNRADGVGLGADVRLAGVSVGKVVAQRLDERYGVVLTFRMQDGVAMPADSAALIYTDGLLGGKYVAIQPGGDEDDLKAGERFPYTQDSMNVPDLLEMIIAQGRARQAAEPASK